MLSRSKVCVEATNRVVEIQERYLSNYFLEPKSSVLLPFEHIHHIDSDLFGVFAEEAFQLLGYADRDIFYRRYNELAHYGLALSGFFLSVNVETGKTDIYTSSIVTLQTMANRGAIMSSSNATVANKLAKLKKVLADPQTYFRSLKEGNTLVAARLNPTMVGRKLKFDPVIPRSKLRLNQEVVVPFGCVEASMKYILQLASQEVLRVSMGGKRRFVTTNADLLRRVYSEDRVQELVGNVIVNPLAGGFYLPSIGASISTFGLTNIKLEDVDIITPVSMDKVLQSMDMSGLRVDYTLSARWFKREMLSGNSMFDLSTVRNIANILKAEGFWGFKDVDVDTADIYTLIGAMVDAEIYDSQAYQAMKAYPDLFSLDKFLSQPKPYGSRVVKVPTDNIDKEKLGELLRTGVYKIVISKRKGGLSTVIGTNSPAHLKRVYGEHYLETYESEGIRLRHLRRRYELLLDDYESTLIHDSIRDLFALYRCDYMIEGGMVTDDLMLRLDEKIQEVEDRRTVYNQDNLLTVRSLVATPIKDEDGNPKLVGYMKNIDPDSIVSLYKYE